MNRAYLGFLLGLLALAWSVEEIRAAEPPGRVYRDKVQPHWFAENTRFWYRVQIAKEAYEFVVVDAERGVRQPAFDHKLLANALLAAGIMNVHPERLPIEELNFTEPGAVMFWAGGKGWRYDLATHLLGETAVPKTKEAIPSGDAPRASRRTGEETSLTFVNHSSGEVSLFWLDPDGARQTYGKLAPGDRREQHTFAGHVWLVADASDKTLGVYEANETGGEVDITGQAQSLVKPPSKSEKGKPQANTSPDRHWQAFFKDSNLWLRNLETGQEVALSQGASEKDSYAERVYWSPDSKKLAAVRTKEGDHRKVYLVESSPQDQLQPKLQSYDYLKPGDRLPVPRPHLFQVAEAREVPIGEEFCPNPWSIEDLRWSPGSDRFTFAFNQRGHQVLRILSVDAVTGSTSVIVEEKSPTFIDYSGKYFCEFLDRPGGPGSTGTSDSPEIVWMSERDGWNHLYLYDAQTGKVKGQITRGPWVVRGVDRVDAEKRQVWFHAGGIRPGQDPYYVHYCRVDFDGNNLVILTEGNGTHSLQFSPDRRFFMDTWSRVDLAPVNELRRSEDGKLVCLVEEGDAQELRASGWRAPEQFIALGRDGQTDIYGVIHWPRNFDPQKKYPVIESIYAGPQDSFVPKSFHVSYPQQAVADHGFIVVQMDGMGTSNRSKKFHDVCWKNLGDAGFPDRIAWLKAAAQKFPSLDLERVGIYGTSAGGQSALGGLLTHGDFYKAGVSDCGCHDNRMDKIWWNEQWMGWPVGAEYAEQSNVTQAHNLQGKLLLMVGELDKNVDPSSTMQVVNALIKADKDFELLVVPGAGHGVLGRPYCQRRMIEFFERWLLARTP